MKGYVYIKDNTYEEIRMFNLSVNGWSSNAKYNIELCNEKNEIIDSIVVTKSIYEHLKNQVATFNQGMEYILKKLKDKLNFKIEKFERDTIWYYSRNIELSRRRIYGDVISNISLEAFMNIAEKWLEKFCEDNQCEIFLLGKNKRHCCVKENAYYKLRYEDLRIKFNEYQDKLIEYVNRK